MIEVTSGEITVSFQCDTSRLPYPVAITAQRFIDALDSSSDVFRTVNCLKDCFEATIKFLGAVLLADYFRSSAATPERNALLFQNLMKPALGHWVGSVVRDVSRWLIDAKVEGTVGRAVAALFFHPLVPKSAKPKRTQLMELCEKFVTYRNETIGHGAMRTDAAYERDLQDWFPMLRELLNGVERLAGYRLQLVTSRAGFSVWMGTESGTTTEAGAFDESLDGHFVLCHATNIETTGQAQPVTDLFPFLCYLPDREQQSRLHFYDSIRRYQETRKEVEVLAYDTGFKCVRPEPIVGLERLLTPELLSKAFKTHQGRMEIIEGRVAAFGELLVKHTNLVGRKFVINAVKRFIDDNDRGLLVIEAEPGKGKTALMCHLIEEVFGHYSPLPIHFFYRRTAGITDPDVCVRTIYHTLLESHELAEGDDWRQETSPEKMLDKLNDLLSKKIAPKLSPSRPQLILIDALDEAEKTSTGKDAFQRIPESLPKGVYIIVTTRKVQNRARLSRRSHVHWYDLDSPDLLQDNLRDGTEFVEDNLKICVLPDEIVKDIARIGAGNFLVLTQLVNRVRESGDLSRAEEFLRRIATEPAGGHLGLIYEEFWERMSARLELHEIQILCNVAGLLVIARCPLSAEIIWECLRLGSADWDFALRHLGEYLTPIEQTEEGEIETYYRIFHESFAEFLRGKITPDHCRLESILAAYCRNWSEHAPGRGWLYALRFGPEHLIRIAQRDPRRWNQLEELLTDIFFLEAKAQAGLVFELADDLSLAWRAIPAERGTKVILRRLEEALRRDILFIAKHAANHLHVLFQCLWNLAWWYGNPKAAPYHQICEQNDGQHKAETAESPGCGEVGDALVQLLERWRNQKESLETGFPWLRSMRPPAIPLGEGIIAAIAECSWAKYSLDGNWILCGDSFSAEIRKADTGKRYAVMPRWDRIGCSIRTVAISPDGSLVLIAWDESIQGQSGDSLDDDELELNEGGTRLDNSEIELDEWEDEEGESEPVDDEEDIDDSEFDFFGPLREHREKETVSQVIRPLLLVWEVGSDDLHEVPQDHTHHITDIAFTDDGSRFATASWDHTIRVHDSKTFAQLVQLPGCERRVFSLCFSPDGTRIVAASDLIRVWDCQTGQILQVFQRDEFQKNFLEEQELLYECDNWSVCFSPDGRSIATNQGGYAVEILDAEKGQIIAFNREHKTRVEHIYFSKDGTEVLSVCEDGKLVVLAADTGKAKRSTDAKPGDSIAICLSPNQDRLLLSVGSQIEIWDAVQFWDTNPNSIGVSRIADGVGDGSDIRFSVDGNEIFAGGVFRDAHTGMRLLLHPFEFGSQLVHRTYSASNHCWIQTSDRDGLQLKLIDMRTAALTFQYQWKHERLAQFIVNNEHLLPMFIDKTEASPDGRRIAIALSRKVASSNSITIIDAVKGSILELRNAHDGKINRMSFSATGERLASASWDNTVKVWNVETGNLVAVIKFKTTILEVWLSPDGNQIVCEHLNNRVGLGLFDANTGGKLFSLQSRKRQMRQVCFSPDGTRVIGADAKDVTGVERKNVMVFIWNAKTGKTLREIQGDADISAIAADVSDSSLRLISRDGESIVETASGQIVALYPSALDDIATHPDGRTWAGAISNYLALIHLEGGNNS